MAAEITNGKVYVAIILMLCLCRKTSVGHTGSRVHIVKVAVTMVLQNINMKWYVAYRTVLFQMILTDLQRQSPITILFKAILGQIVSDDFALWHGTSGRPNEFITGVHSSVSDRVAP